jgi:hypothetical protein
VKLFKSKILGKGAIFALILSIGLIGGAAFADNTAHWSDNVVDKWSNLGYIELDQAGNFNPDQGITRKEFVRLVNKTFGYTDMSPLAFKDVEKDNPYYLDILAAREAGYISGYEDNTFKPEGTLTRAEVATIISRILKLEIPEGDMYISNFADYASIQDWSKPYIGSVVRKGYLKGYEDNTVKSNKEMTKAEALTLLNNVTGTVLNKAGSYSLGEFKGNITINTSDVVLKDTILKGDIILASGIGEGDSTLDGVKLNGTLFVNGGGENSIHLKDSDIYGVNVSKKNGRVRVVAEGETKVLNAKANSGAKFQSEKSSFKSIEVKGTKSQKVVLEGNFDAVKSEGAKLELVGKTQVKAIEAVGGKNEISLAKDSVLGELKAKSDVSLDAKGKVEKLEASKENQKLDIKGNVSELKIDKKANVSLVGSKVGKVSIGAKSEGTNLVADKASNIADVEVSAEASLSGQGKIEKATVNSEGVKIAQKVETVKKGAGVVSMEVGGKEVTKSVTKPTKKPSTSGSSSSKKSSGGGGGSSHKKDRDKDKKPTPPKPTPKAVYKAELSDTFNGVSMITKDLTVTKDGKLLEGGYVVKNNDGTVIGKDTDGDGITRVPNALHDGSLKIEMNDGRIIEIK